MNTVDVQWRLLKQEDIQQSPSRNYRPPQPAANGSTAASGSQTPSAVSPLHLPFFSHSQVLLSSSPLASDDERRLRCHWSSFLQLCGLMLELPNVTVCTALVYFHRFYAVCPFQEYDPALCVQACLLLASKVEENSRRVRDVINVAYHAAHQHEAALAISPLYWDVKELVLRQEQTLLRALSFDLSYTHPHCYLLHITRHLECSTNLASLAYYILNDAGKSTLSLQYAPPSIACAAIYLASEMVNETVIGKTATAAAGGAAGGGGGGGGAAGGGVGSEGEREWWEEFGANRMELEAICHQLMDLYELLEHEAAAAAAASY